MNGSTIGGVPTASRSARVGCARCGGGGQRWVERGGNGVRGAGKAEVWLWFGTLEDVDNLVVQAMPDGRQRRCRSPDQNWRMVRWRPGVRELERIAVFALIGPASALPCDATARHPSPVRRSLACRAEARLKGEAKDGGPDLCEFEPTDQLATPDRPPDAKRHRRISPRCRFTR